MRAWIGMVWCSHRMWPVWCLAALCGGLLWSNIARAEDWPGWRGVAHEGVATSAGPVHWSPSTAVRWKTPLPGTGHSSPIVSGSRIYLTTAIPQSGQLPRHLLVGIFTVALGLLFWAFGVRAVVRQCRMVVRTRELLGLTVRLLLWLAFLFVLIFGEQILDFARTPERPWFGVALFGLLGLHLAGVSAPDASRARWLFGFALLAFAGLLAGLVPDRWLFTTQLGHVQTLFYLTVIVVTACTGLLGVSRAPWLRGGGWLRWLARIGIAAALVTLTVATVQQQAGILRDGSSWKYYHIVLPWWSPLPFLALAGYGVFRRRRLGASLPAHLAMVAGSALSVVFLLLVAWNQGLRHVLFLSHLWGRPYWFLTPSTNGLMRPFLVSLAEAVVLGIPAFRWLRAADGLPVPVRWLALPLVGLFAVFALALPPGRQVARCVMALDRATGRVLWTNQALMAPPGTLHSDNSPATPTPVTDGTRIYAYFGTAGIVCTDLRGRTVWTSRQLPFATRMGVASSPILYQDLLIVDSESDMARTLAALDTRTGAIVWSVPLRRRIHSYAGNCRTPALLTVDGTTDLVSWGYDVIQGFDPRTGRQRWSYAVGNLGNGNNPVNSFVTDARALYLTGLHAAVKLDARRLVHGRPPELWRQTGVPVGTECSSPVLVHGLLFATTDGGMRYCLDAATGAVLWRHGQGGVTYPSLLSDGTHVYFTRMNDGRITVVAAERTYRELAVSVMGGKIYASPVLTDGLLLLRTDRFLYAIAAE